MRKRISRLTAEMLPWYLRLYGVMIGASIPAEYHRSGSLWGIPREERFGRWTMAEFLFLALTGKRPIEAAVLPVQILIGLLISSGPGAISAQGAKGAVSADGPQTPDRVQINKAMVGFLTHSGYSHGGNGFEGMAFLLEQFKDVDLTDPTDPRHGLDLRAMATRFAEAYKAEKAQAKEMGLTEARALPGVHHPVFKGKPVNYDPRERFIAEFMEKRRQYNIFHAFYRELVQALYDTVAVLGEIETLLLSEGRFQIGCLPDQARLAFLADSAFEHRLDKNQLVAIDKTLDFALGRAGPQNLRLGKSTCLRSCAP